ncbi:hypothetical protein [Bdellovibrio reynosensis]|uniref:Uncharacterized protein n=1 Tax=Bdellovibrio reynosensis TaxID=2835041 RepID=A0ABY4CC05_9BACT|nr:hypothetical protein [Bdellovibrio reynosensis]UOF02373.1 hypothetical protein MNR06_05340 [Bdellovibrio reynosensis]
MKNKNIFLAGILLAVSSQAFAATDVVGEKTIQLKDNKGEAIVISRENEEGMGRPYTIELRVNCTGSKTKWETLPVVESESVCDVKPRSARLTGDGKSVAIMIRETDSDEYNRLSKTMDPAALGEMKPICKKAAKELRFSLEGHCKK